MINIDNFKSINHRFDHAAEDAALRAHRARSRERLARDRSHRTRRRRGIRSLPSARGAAIETPQRAKLVLGLARAVALSLAKNTARLPTSSLFTSRCPGIRDSA